MRALDADASVRRFPALQRPAASDHRPPILLGAAARSVAATIGHVRDDRARARRAPTSGAWRTGYTAAGPTGAGPRTSGRTTIGTGASIDGGVACQTPWRRRSTRRIGSPTCPHRRLDGRARRRRRDARCPSPASVSSSSQPARGSPSRGWPTLPGLTSSRSPPSSATNGAIVGAVASGHAIRALRPGDRQMGVAEQPERRRAACSRLARAIAAVSDVLPDRVARAAVDEERVRLARGSPGRARSQSTVAGEIRPRVHSIAALRVVVEPVDLATADGCPIVVAGDADGADRRQSGDDGIRLRAVADDVAEVPDGVDRPGARRARPRGRRGWSGCPTARRRARGRA